MAKLRKVNKGYTNSERWDTAFNDLRFEYPESRPTRTRLGEDLFTIPQHYVQFKAKDGSKKGFYALCLNWDYDAEEKVDHKCPYCECDINCTEYTYGCVIKRADQKKEIDQPLMVRMTPKLVNDIINLADTAYPDEEWPEGFEEEEKGVGPDATDRKYGFDLMLKISKSGKRTEYPVGIPQNGICALKKDEYKSMKSFMEQFDVRQMAKSALPTVEAARKDLMRLGLLKSSVPDDIDSDDFDMPDDEDRPVAKRKSKGKSKPSNRKVTSISGDDDNDDFDDDNDDDVSKTYAHSEGADDPSDDDFDEDFDD